MPANAALIRGEKRYNNNAPAMMTPDYPAQQLASDNVEDVAEAVSWLSVKWRSDVLR